MALEIQNRVCQLVHEVYGGQLGSTPEWLLRPGRFECKRRWPLVQRIYEELTGMELGEVMPHRERRAIDAILIKSGQPARLLEVDETQHFNEFRAMTLRSYPRSVRVAFPMSVWIARSEAKQRLEGGGFGKPKPPLFPGDGGRHRQRAFRDALADILPPAHGWAPTLRIADFEIQDWIFAPDSRSKMTRLLASRV
jgi:hypothetical protein